MLYIPTRNKFVVLVILFTKTPLIPVFRRKGGRGWGGVGGGGGE